MGKISTEAGPAESFGDILKEFGQFACTFGVLKYILTIPTLNLFWKD